MKEKREERGYKTIKTIATSQEGREVIGQRSEANNAIDGLASATWQTEGGFDGSFDGKTPFQPSKPPCPNLQACIAAD
jgi:hypothetical protein